MSRTEPAPARLVVAIASRALFDLEESHSVYALEGVAAYRRYQVERERDPLGPGIAFALVRKLLALNAAGAMHADAGGAGGEAPPPLSWRPVEVVLLSRNSADTGLRIFNSIEHHGLDITRAAFTSGAAPYRYATPFGAHLFLSADAADVRAALDAGVAAATIAPSAAEDAGTGPLRIAFDGDAVLFSDQAERVYRREGLDAFARHEKHAAEEPLPGGPFQGFLAALHALQDRFEPAGGGSEGTLIRTALVTARAAPAHERVVRTLRAWGVRIDEAVFLGGLDKSGFLAAFGADFFFDDQRGHYESASRQVTAGHVPYGVANE